MGLAGPKNRTKIGADPRNTHWASNTSRFGHRMLQSQGWTPGSALGSEGRQHLTDASFAHIRVLKREDGVGIGAEGGGDECTGLEGLQGILGRLNGRGEEVKEKERQRLVMRLGMRWVKGETLVGGELVGELARQGITIETKEKKEEREEKEQRSEEKNDKKRRRDDEGSEKAEKKEKKKRRKEKEDESDEKKDKKDESDEKKDKKDKKRSKDKDSKREKKERKKEKKNKSTSTSPSISEDSTPIPETDSSKATLKSKSKSKSKSKDKDSKKSKKSKKSKMSKTDSSSSSSDSESESDATPVPDTHKAPTLVNPMQTGRHALRARFIAAKRSAVMDDAALKEILMVKTAA